MRKIKSLEEMAINGIYGKEDFDKKFFNSFEFKANVYENSRNKFKKI